MNQLKLILCTGYVWFLSHFYRFCLANNLLTVVVEWWIVLLVLSATFINISAISWRPGLVVEEAGVPGENHRPWKATGKLYHLRLRVHPFCKLQSRARTHAVRVIGLYELLGNPTS